MDDVIPLCMTHYYWLMLLPIVFSCINRLMLLSVVIHILADVIANVVLILTNFNNNKLMLLPCCYY